MRVGPDWVGVETGPKYDIGGLTREKSTNEEVSQDLWYLTMKFLHTDWNTGRSPKVRVDLIFGYRTVTGSSGVR